MIKMILFISVPASVCGSFILFFLFVLDVGFGTEILKKAIPLGAGTVVSWLVSTGFVYYDFIKREWEDEIKYELWKRLFFWGFFLGNPWVSIVYYYRVIKNAKKDCPLIAKRKSKDTRILFDMLCLGGLGLKISIAFFVILFFVGPFLPADFPFESLFKLVVIAFIMLIATAYFDYKILNDIVCRKWIDYSFMDFFAIGKIFANIEYETYYHKIVRKELEKSE